MSEKALSIITDLRNKEGNMIKAARYMAFCVAAGIDERVALEMLDVLKKNGEIEFISEGIFEILSK